MATPTPSTFKGYQFTQYGDAIENIKLNPSIKHHELKPTEVRVKVYCAGVNPADYLFVEHGAMLTSVTPSADHPFGVGCDFSGVIDEVGADVTTFQVGDAVYGVSPFESFGTMAEYFYVDSKFVAHKPKNMTFKQAAGVPGVAHTGYEILVTKFGKVQPGDRVLILGGSGGCGSAGVQIAKSLGAYVIATTSTRNVEFVKSLGADEVIDYTSSKWGEVLKPHSIDFIYNCGVEPESWNGAAQTVLKPQTGKFVAIFFIEQPVKDSPIGASLFEYRGSATPGVMAEISKIIEAEQLITPIDSVYPFENFTDAIKRQMTKRARGKIIIEIVKQDASED